MDLYWVYNYRSGLSTRICHVDSIWDNFDSAKNRADTLYQEHLAKEQEWLKERQVSIDAGPVADYDFEVVVETTPINEPKHRFNTMVVYCPEHHDNGQPN